VEGRRIVPHEVVAPGNGGNKEDSYNFGLSPKHGSPNFDVSTDAVFDGGTLGSENSAKLNIRNSEVTAI
jgi:hypothetical protein